MTRSAHSGNRDGKLRILLLLLYYHPHPTGLTYYVKTLAEGLAARSHDVTVLAAHHAAETPRGESQENGVRVLRLWAPIRLSRGMIMPAYPWHLRRLLREHDVVNIHSPMLESALAAFLARRAKVPAIATHHADLVLPKGFMNNLITKLMFANHTRMARSVDCMVSYSEDNMQHSVFLAPYREKTMPIYPPINIPEPQTGRVEQMRAAWRHEGGPLIGFSGRFAQEKRPDLLIRSLDIVNQTYRNARVVFAGEIEIPYEDTWNRFRGLVKCKESQLIFLGLLRDKQELANFYAACDVLVVPSDIDNFPLVQGEAMLCGTPVVASGIYGNRVAVSVTGMGKLAKKGDWRSIGEAIVEVLAAPQNFIKPREAIAQIFSKEKTLDDYEALFIEHASK